MTKLTDRAIKSAKPARTIKKLSDGHGLTLVIHPNGSKYWVYRYRYLGKEKTLSLGIYPEVSLADARLRLAEARKQIANQQDPSQVRKLLKREAIVGAGNSFEAIAREWMDAKAPGWVPRYASYLRRRMENDLFPKLGSRPIKEITAPELLSVLRIIEQRGAFDLANRALQCSGQVFMYAIATGRAERNPAADLKGALKTPVKKHFAHLKATELPDFVERLKSYDGHPQTKLAVTLLMLTFVRTSELRGAQWDELDLDKAEWRIPAERMKMRRDHIVPLSKQAKAAFKELNRLNGNSQYVFTNPHNSFKSMSENAVLCALYRMGYHSRATGHGFRHTASTVLNESGLFGSDVIERQLAHVHSDKVRGVYNHAEYLPQRRKMMQWWADYLDEMAAKKQPTR
jgi:integrase